MLTTLTRRISKLRLLAMMILALFTGALVVETADARAGRRSGGGGMFRSFGDRGSRSSDAGRMQPVPGSNRSTAANNTQNGRNNLNNQGSWLQRNPLMAGLMGALAGTVIGAMLMNAFGGMGGMGGMGSIIGIILMAGLAFLAFAVIRGLMQKKQPRYAGGPGPGQQTNYANPVPGLGGYRDNVMGGGVGGSAFDGPGVQSQSKDQGLAAIAILDPSMTRERLQDTLSARFFQIQEAWSAGDRANIMNGATREMYEELMDELDAMERRSERNVIKNIVIRSFDLTEAWHENELEYTTAHIQARLLDYTEKAGQVVEGDTSNPVQFNEYWTFVRPRGRGEWKLTSINQEA